MEVPKELKGEQRKAWLKLFGDCFRPKSVAEIEMSIRFVDWLLLFEQDREIVRQNGTVIDADNGIPYTSPHYKNMVTSEDNMRRLWAVLVRSIVERKDDTGNLGQFSNT